MQSRCALQRCLSRRGPLASLIEAVARVAYDEKAACAAAQSEALTHSIEEQLQTLGVDDIPGELTAAAVYPPLDKSTARTAVRHVGIAKADGRYNFGIFLLPPGGRIPLHDHPGMCVVSKLLVGTAKVTSYEQIPEANGKANPVGGKSVRVRRLGSQICIAPCSVSLTACRGNFHALAAGEDGAAVLDVIIPPYELNKDRACTYYSVLRELGQSEEGEDVLGSECELIPIDAPRDFRVIGGILPEQLTSDEDDED
eukprot:TRINITY_DN25797_c0_g1_i1.p1 TRINITY_DN25797_c0_g1~~TRINITY_DN25797_c0_g1_i1.p1  ORF type:complete len:255 (-),score=32.85 TRINITY_DN25797_c0_g1_i1:352-1116(-)